MKKEIMQMLSDFSVVKNENGSYENRIIKDTDFDELSEDIIEFLNKRN